MQRRVIGIFNRFWNFEVNENGHNISFYSNIKMFCYNVPSYLLISNLYDIFRETLSVDLRLHNSLDRLLYDNNPILHMK